MYTSKIINFRNISYGDIIGLPSLDIHRYSCNIIQIKNILESKCVQSKKLINDIYSAVYYSAAIAK